MVEVEFTLVGIKTVIQCKQSDTLRDIINKFTIKREKNINDIYFIYNSNSIKEVDYDLTFDQFANQYDKLRNKMSILVNEKDNTKDVNAFIKSKEIVCPKCRESILFSINDYMITLDGCKNKHTTKDLSFTDFESTQFIDESKIVCGKCKNNNKAVSTKRLFYRCNTCKMNLCILCNATHDKSHNIVDYDSKNYFCEPHNEKFISYCKNCKKNLCVLCEGGHESHELSKYKISQREDKINELQDLKSKIDTIKSNIQIIKEKLDKAFNTIMEYYSLCSFYIDNYDIRNRNYEILNNINKLISKDIMNDLNKIINENDINKKFKEIIEINNKVNKGGDKSIFNNTANINNMAKQKKRISQNINKDYQITILYKINENDDKIKIFDNEFISNNEGKCTYMCEDNEYELEEYFDLYELESRGNMLEIKLNHINKITDMSSMFFNCKSLTSLPDINKWDTSNVTNMSSLFFDCRSLTSIADISKWNTSKVTDMSRMFGYCEKLTSLPNISKWDTSNVTDMREMFSNCSSLTSLPDISKWKTNKVVDMENMFYDCRSLSSLPDISKWNTNNVTDMSYMFYDCEKLSTFPNISKWDVSNLKYKESMFDGCKATTNIPSLSK